MPSDEEIIYAVREVFGYLSLIELFQRFPDACKWKLAARVDELDEAGMFDEKE